MKAMELLIERIILSARWLLVVFYVGLAFALGVYSVAFLYKLAKVTGGVFTLDESGMILAMLGLIDVALVASLIVMVMISSYENFVSRFDGHDNEEISWPGKLDAGSLKVASLRSVPFRRSTPPNLPQCTAI